ncbi:hypothetical protein LMG18091_00932 [Ralstonia wenshanensis]|uniref:Uncharacterized protein n=1 Tax=Ralstonia wenshanensis TaxID=2842456 RepID=A0AAD2ATE5_9RALS|nr:hypothetical protein LMG18091_00932 [Ralstonia wenshanensis]
MRRRKPTRTALKIVSGNPCRSASPKDGPALVAGAKAPAWPTPLSRSRVSKAQPDENKNPFADLVKKPRVSGKSLSKPKVGPPTIG